jgi:hypothetical protein
MYTFIVQSITKNRSLFAPQLCTRVREGVQRKAPPDVTCTFVRLYATL